MVGLTVKIKHSLMSLMRYNKKWNDFGEDNDNNNDDNESHSLFRSIRQMFNEESKHVNISTNILAHIQDSNNYTSQSGKFSFIFRLAAEGKIIDCCQWNLPKPPDNKPHVLPTEGFAIFIDVKFTRWGSNYHYLYSKQSSIIYDFCPHWIKIMKGNIDNCVDDRIHYIWTPFHQIKENHAFIRNIRIKEMHDFGQMEKYITKSGESANLKIATKSVQRIVHDQLQINYKCPTCNTITYNNISFGCCGKMNPDGIKTSCKLDIYMKDTAGAKRIHVTTDGLISIVALVSELQNPTPSIPQHTRNWYELIKNREAKIMDDEELMGLTPALKVFCNIVKDMDNIMMNINGALLGDYSNKTLWFFLKKVWFDVSNTKKRKEPPHTANSNGNIKSDIDEPPRKKHRSSNN